MVQTGESQLIRTKMVLLGASNLTRGIATVVGTARRLAGPRLEVLAALGHGRSYGITSSIGFGVRSLPGILECGLWSALEHSKNPKVEQSKIEVETDRTTFGCSDVSTFALITDIGNDVLYGVMPEQITAWVELCINRLESQGARVAMTLPPIETIRRVTAFQFLVVKTVMFPTHALQYKQALQRADELHDRLVQLATARNITCLAPRIEWYGFDPIHIRRRYWRQAWGETISAMVGKSQPHHDQQVNEPQTELSTLQRMKLRLTLPERCRLLGFSVGQRQPARVLSDGTTISLF